MNWGRRLNVRLVWQKEKELILNPKEKYPATSTRERKGSVCRWDGSQRYGQDQMEWLQDRFLPSQNQTGERSEKAFWRRVYTSDVHQVALCVHVFFLLLFLFFAFLSPTQYYDHIMPQAYRFLKIMANKILKVVTWNTNGSQRPIQRRRCLAFLKGKDFDINMMRQVVCYREPSKKSSLERVWEHAGTFKKYLAGDSICLLHISQANFNQLNQQTLWRSRRAESWEKRRAITYFPSRKGFFAESSEITNAIAT